MRAPGLSLVLLGLIAFLIPLFRVYVHGIPLSDFELQITAAGMFIAGGVILFLTRER